MLFSIGNSRRPRRKIFSPPFITCKVTKRGLKLVDKQGTGVELPEGKISRGSIKKIRLSLEKTATRLIHPLPKMDEPDPKYVSQGFRKIKSPQKSLPKTRIRNSIWD